MTIVEDQAAAKPKKAANKTEVAVHREAAAPLAGNLVVLQQALARGATGEDLKNMMDLYERMEDRAARRAFDDAMARVQEEMPALVKNRLVDYETSKKDSAGNIIRTTYRHEDLSLVVETIKPVLHKHGLAHRFRTEQLDGGAIKVTCVITGHGHREETSLVSGRDSSGGKNDIQGIGSTVTYLERYTLKAALGLAAAHDDDSRKSEGTSGTITALQMQELVALIKEVDAKEANVCKACKVDTLAELTQAQFERAKAKLETMRAPL